MTRATNKAGKKQRLQELCEAHTQALADLNTRKANKSSDVLCSMYEDNIREMEQKIVALVKDSFEKKRTEA